MVDERDDETVEGDAGRATRRTFLKTTASAAAAVMVGCGGDDASDAMPPDTSPPEGGVLDSSVDAVVDTAMDAAPVPVVPPELTPLTLALFELGVASGDVTHEEAVIWTQYKGSERLTLAVWEMDGDTYERVVSEEMVSPEINGYVHRTVLGLTGGRRYRYAFFEVAESGRVGRSTIGRFRAALEPGQMEDLVIGACSCTKNGRDFATLERAGEREDLDVFLLLGDTTYNDGAVSLDDHRGRWSENFRTAGYRETRAATSVVATWDDHEVRNNFDSEDPMLDEGRQAFFENLPLGRDAAEPNRMWKSIRWGLTAELFILDCRGERKPSTRSTTDEYISRAQMDWLKAALLASPSVFKIIVNSVPISCFPGLFDIAINDRWEGYPLQRTEILSHIDDNVISGVMWVAGDFHLCSSQRVSETGQAGDNQREILSGPGAQTGNPATLALVTEPRFDFALTTDNYTTLELFPATNTIRVRWIDGSGTPFETRSYIV